MMSDFDYSVRVKNGSAWRAFNHIRLMISVGKDYHEGNKLAAVVNWINRNPEIREIHISVNDLLQRHNYIAEGMSPEEAEKISQSEGALWMARNSDLLSEIKVPVLYSRWQDWFGQAEFKAAHQEILAYARENPALRNAIDQDAQSLAERKAKRGESIPATLIEHSRNYIEEELSVFALQSAEYPAAEVYPGSNLKCAEYFLNLEDGDKEKLPERTRPLAYRYFTRIDFSRIHLVPAVAQAG